MIKMQAATNHLKYIGYMNKQISAPHAAYLLITCLICLVDYTITKFGYIKMDGVVLLAV
jgi:hypothetical protein